MGVFDMAWVFEKYYLAEPSGEDVANKTTWRVEYCSQVLYSGSWDDDYPDWGWESTYDEFGSLNDAERKFKKFEPTDDTPFAYLEEVKYNKYEQIDSIEVLDENPQSNFVEVINTKDATHEA
jgi:hypothetical protein